MKYALIPVAVMLSASAQIMLKKASASENWSLQWFIFVMASGAIYVGALFLYMELMRIYPISRIYPALTILVIVIITVYGTLLGEPMSARRLAGLALGGVAAYLLLA